MTNTLTLRSVDIPSIQKFAVGFDQMFDELLRGTSKQSNINYPPYNVIKIDEDKFAIELAVAGFSTGDVKITVENNILTVNGEKTISAEYSEQPIEYLHHGISSRSFNRNWTLAEHMEVLDAKQENGILTINLERQIPEHKKPKVISIDYVN